ncbi:hypothetical protein CL1_1237 [Thermococcus cleftensis]|uniref:Uncharacterized protein n=1 Tax=Thermococcus cleftensis (strain DSM 27260 / KACC 17922 / CL1) TaxID=163003 RepID=I3ZUQ2_THECF|nr:hypothetical protein [Thermococcus cleftensis]AFL95436.1 hypothetical protein CL1_1237 [Thermococcus cleftensis]
MRKAPVLMALVFLLMVPLASAAGVTYYPDREAFQAFLSSDSTYTVVPGNDTWARAWAYYVDEKLYTIKAHGNDTLVLVGNVYNNRLIASLWNQTGLPANASLLPSIVVLNNTVLITGSEDNIYLTERAFEGLWNPPRSSAIAFLSLTFGMMLAFLALLSRDDSHAGRFYALAASLFMLWYLTAERPKFTHGFLAQLLSALEFTAGSPPDSPISAIMGAVFTVVPPIEENVVFIHWLLILVIMSFSFYLAPKRSRELGFLVFGLTFVAPMFRNGFSEINGATLGLAGFIIALAIVSNVTFSPEKWKALLQTGVLSIFTLLAIAINPYLVLMPVAFVLTFPKRYLRNYAYLLMTGAGVFLLYTAFGLSLNIPSSLPPSAVSYAKNFLMNSSLALTTGVYALWNRKKGITMRGTTAFLLLMTVIYTPLALFAPSLFPYCFVLLSALAVRLLHGLTPRA